MFKKIAVLTILFSAFLLQQKSFADQTFSTVEQVVPYGTYQNQNGWSFQNSQNVNPSYYQYNNPYVNRYQSPYGYRTPYGYRGYVPVQSDQTVYGAYPQGYYNGVQNPVIRNIGANILYSLLNH